ncbi:hypothetical protein ACHAXT_008538 [Thalassiosira profunda]
MFDISWGELAVLTGVGLALVGRRDLPVASRAVGQQVGRIVGLLQGARLRADRFASDHQLKQLQNEFRSGLRELDAVKAELAGSMAHRAGVGGGGGNLGALVSGVDRKRPAAMMGGAPPAAADGAAAATSSMTPSSMGADYLAAAQQAESSQGNSPPIQAMEGGAVRLAPRTQSVAAVAEEEWEKRGIGFRSVAEGRGIQQHNDSLEGTGGAAPVGAGGAVILSNYLRQSLIYDQYERTVREQDDALRSRVEKVRHERSGDGGGEDNNAKTR